MQEYLKQSENCRRLFKRRFNQMDNQYQQELQSNQEQFMALLKAARPDIWQIASVIDEYQLNPTLVIHFLYGLNSVMESTKYGAVSTEIEDGIVRFIRSNNNRKLNEPVKQNYERFD